MEDRVYNLTRFDKKNCALFDSSELHAYVIFLCFSYFF